MNLISPSPSPTNCSTTPQIANSAENELSHSAPPQATHAVYVDFPFVAVAKELQAIRTGQKHGHRWCHMWSEDIDALHAMADRIGMRRAWFQDKPGFAHYDLVPPRRAMAIRFGAIERPLIDFLRERRSRASLSPSNPSIISIASSIK